MSETESETIFVCPFAVSAPSQVLTELIRNNDYPLLAHFLSEAAENQDRHPYDTETLQTTCCKRHGVCR